MLFAVGPGRVPVWAPVLTLATVHSLQKFGPPSLSVKQAQNPKVYEQGEHRQLS